MVKTNQVFTHAGTDAKFELRCPFDDPLIHVGVQFQTS